MGLILPQTVKIKWTGNTRKYYESKGYVYTKNLDEFEVNVQDLSKGSSTLVDIECDFCNAKTKINYKAYLNLRSSLYCCQNCLLHKKKYRDENGNLCFMDIPYRNKEWLYNEYIVKNRMAEDIANDYSINIRTLREWISKFELVKYGKLKNELSKENLYEMYYIKHMTSEEIAKIYNTTGNTVISLLKQYGYKVPTRSELLDIYYNQKGGYDKVRITQSTMESRIKSSCRQRGITIEEFDGFSTTEQHMARNNTYYKEWIRKVFERDDYTCQCCGKRGGNLNAHHLYNFSEYPNLRYDISNGITFCRECHLINFPNSFHSIYGERNNTPEQVIEFIQNYKEHNKEVS